MEMIRYHCRYSNICLTNIFNYEPLASSKSIQERITYRGSTIPNGNLYP